MSNKQTNIIYHHSAINTKIQSEQFDVINNYHRDVKKFYKSSLGFYGGYHYLIELTGKIKQYKLPTDIGCHCIGMNSKSIGICLAGNFSEEHINPEQKVSFGKLLKEIMNKYNIPLSRVYPHRHFRNTECPGITITDSLIKNLLSTENVKVELLKKQITIIQKLIEIYVKLLNFLKVKS